MYTLGIMPQKKKRDKYPLLCRAPDDDHVLAHGALLSNASRMGTDAAAGSSVLSGRHDTLGGQVLERPWWRLERKNPGRSKPSEWGNSSRLTRQRSLGNGSSLLFISGLRRNRPLPAKGIPVFKHQANLACVSARLTSSAL